MNGGDGALSAGQRKPTTILTLALASACVPFFAAEFIPSTDLPQHLAQIRLLEALWGLRDANIDTSQLSARPFGANTLVYWPLFLLSRIAPLRIAGKLTLVLIFASSVLGYHALARARGRDPLHVLAVVPLLFSVSFYWGFLNFLSGLPLFLFYLARLSRGDQPPRLTRYALDGLLLLTLYWAHVFWVAVAGVATLVLVAERDLRPLLRRALTFVPVAALLAWWYPQLVEARRSAGFHLGTHYLVSFPERLSTKWFVQTLFGGIYGFLEPTYAVLLVLYVVWTCWHAYRLRAFIFDRRLVALGIVLIAFAFFAPDQHLNTILLNRRFLPIGVALALLALPTVGRREARALAGTAVALFSLLTALAWALFDQLDLAGLRESLERIPHHASVLGLDYRKASNYVRDRPFLQMFAYAQVERGGELSFSFAEHSSSIVTYDGPRRIEWTPGLEWVPDRVTKRDLEAFTCVLVNGEDEDHQQFRAKFGVDAALEEGYFRPYCRASSPSR